jgi:hypothetical protein
VKMKSSLSALWGMPVMTFRVTPSRSADSRSVASSDVIRRACLRIPYARQTRSSSFRGSSSRSLWRQDRSNLRISGMTFLSSEMMSRYDFPMVIWLETW